MEYQFNGEKYITKGIAEMLPSTVQILIFSGIDIMRKKTDGKLDYLQVFTLKTFGENENMLLNIMQEQETPERHINYVIPTDKTINTKVYIIDDIDHVTMLLAEEY